ncbi:MAG: IS66 family transposase [Thermoleophilaceae bacterium]
MERIAELEAMVPVLAEQNQRLLARVAELERELGRHSGNSGKPPSSDTVTQRQAQQEERLSRAERRRRARAKAKELLDAKDQPKRRPGKQPGEPGARLDFAEDPDAVVEHRPARCSGCDGELRDAEVCGTERRQVFDLPRRRLEVTEHRAHTCRCRCGTTTKAQFPPAARATTCYGPAVRALGCYLVARQHLPVARAAELLADALGAPVSTGWLAGITLEAADGLEGFLDELRRQLIAADVLHADETGARISGARWWFHVACTDLLTLLDCHDRRGVAAFADMAVLPFFSGVLVSDGWKPYWSVGAAEHALCCAHLLRDLASVAQVATQQPWADAMADLLVQAKRAVDAAGNDGLDRRQLRSLRARYTRILTIGCAANPEPAPGRKRNALERESWNLLRRLDTQRHDVQRHWTNPAVAFDNNQAERDVRMVKLQQKISGCFRTLAGARAFCAVRSYLQTAAKHGVGQLDALTRLFNGHPWMPPSTAAGP